MAPGEAAETMKCTGEERQVWDIAGLKLLTDLVKLIARLDEIKRSVDKALQVRPVRRP